MKNLMLLISISLAAGLLFANVYTSLIDARSWGSDIPKSIGVAREYFKTVNPGNYFRLFSPINQVVALLVVILCWKLGPSVRWLLLSALLLYILTDVITFAFFYPRNEVLFSSASLSDVETLKKAWSEWSAVNWVRSFMLLVGLCCSFLALHRIYLQK
jgi:uncharacterized membrane protein